MSKKNKFSSAEKYKIALEAIKGELTQAQITSKYQVHATQINKWKKEALEYLQAAFTNKLHSSELAKEHEEQLAELYQQIGQLKVENDFLKKKRDLFK
jgi:transposase-like protein